MKSNSDASRSCCIPSSINSANIEHPELAISNQCHDFPIDLIDLAGGTFQMGANDGAHPQDGEGPVRKVSLSGFSIASCAISNSEFNAFIQATGYLTVAERKGDSFVFYQHLKHPDCYPAPTHTPWWRKVKGANWRQQHGPESSIQDAMDHPVVHIAQEDALAFCFWSGHRLPSEAEWEFAARGGLDQAPYPWGTEMDTAEQPLANTWRGDFPHRNPRLDGFSATVPVDYHSPNGYGLYNTTGNVWERTADRFTHLHSSRPCKDPKGPLNGTTTVGKGGSYLCHPSYCQRYRTSSRQSLAADTTSDNIGFRVASNT